MADDDIFGEQQVQNSNFKSSKIFGGDQIPFNQPTISPFGGIPGGMSLKSNLGFDPKSNPSFTTRRK